ncbi:biliverdin-producing heme oxygenase [Pseudomonas abietaniphila]|uniref:biliverdin-producing heme oxygenase n=1 Tax=Pseudomonas abietaniphila TaxID=89065 RepID=UPI003D36904C
MVEATPELLPSRAATQASCVLQMLRAATAAQHKALEARLPLTHPDLDRDAYQRIIQAYYGFHAPLQRQIERFHAPRLAQPERQKVPALVKDLRALGLSDAQIDALPMCADLPPINGEADLLGVMYVMEGATLGGQVLRRIIADRLAIDADSGGEFLDVYGRDTGRLWKAFLTRLADFDHPDDNPQVVESACATFALFARWLECNGVLR